MAYLMQVLSILVFLNETKCQCTCMKMIMMFLHINL